MSHELVIKKSQVNSDRLFEEINEFIEQGLRTPGISWTNHMHRDSFSEVINEWMEEFTKAGKITQFKLVTDDRINPPSQSDNIFRVSLTYKQAHCLNTTVLDYVVTESDEDDTEELLSYMLTP